MSERDPFEHLRDLIDEPVAPRAEFADALRSRLMREMSASDYSREEQQLPMDATFAPRPPLAFPIEPPRRIRPMVILEMAAAAVIIIGLAAALGRGWFQNDPDPATAVPAAFVQGNGTATPETQPEPTSTPLPTVVPERTGQATTPDSSAMEPTAVPPGNIPNTIWAIPGIEGENVELGGLLTEDDTVYRLLATPSFVGVQAIDAETGEMLWQQAHRWAGNLFAIEDDVLYFDGGGNTLTAVDAKTGAELWRANIAGDPLALTEDEHRLFVLLSTDMVTARDAKTGEELWIAQMTAPQQSTGGSASLPAIDKIAVEDSIVAAVSTTGVLSGFDAKTGEERWAHEGYDAATVAIWDEDDRFIVTSGAGIPVAGDDISSTTTTVAGVDDSVVRVVVNAGDCSQFDATPEDGTETHTFRAQAIDPETGDVLWDRQTIIGNTAATVTTSENLMVCGIDIVTGDVTADTSPNRILTVGTATSGTSGIHHLHVEDGTVVMVGDVGGPNQQAIAVTTDDHTIYLQLADGSLVKIADGHDTDHDDSSHDSHDTDDDGSPESGDDD